MIMDLSPANDNKMLLEIAFDRKEISPENFEVWLLTLMPDQLMKLDHQYRLYREALKKAR